MFTLATNMRVCMLAPLLACAPTAATYEYGLPLSDVSFVFFDSQEGIHPSDVTLRNPNNPFSYAMPAKWEIESAGYPQASFYGWATTLTMEPTGEHQFYTALSLQRIFEQSFCLREECYMVRKMALEAYQTQLDSFPYSVSYTADGVPFPIDILAYEAILSLGGVVKNWQLSQDAEGNEILIPKDTP